MNELNMNELQLPIAEWIQHPVWSGTVLEGQVC